MENETKEEAREKEMLQIAKRMQKDMNTLINLGYFVTDSYSDIIICDNRQEDEEGDPIKVYTFMQ